MPRPFATAAYDRLLAALKAELEQLTHHEQLDVLESLGTDVDDRIEHLEEQLEFSLAITEREPAEAR